MKQFTRILSITIVIIIVIRISHEYQKQNDFQFFWKNFLFSNGDRKMRRQDIIAPMTQQVATVKVSQGAETKATFPTLRPSSTRSLVTLQNLSVTLPKSVTTQRVLLQTTMAASVKENQHVVVPNPVDVIPVQTVPPQQFLPSKIPPTQKQNFDAGKLNRTHLLLPNLPVYNVPARPQDVKPVIPVKEVPKQAQIKTEMDPIEPLPIITRPTVTVLQHVIRRNPTQATLQSVVVPKRKYASPPPALTPLPVLPPQTVASPMKPLRPLPPLPPLPPQEPHIIQHIPILVPTNCGDSHPCGCENGCSGK